MPSRTAPYPTLRGSSWSQLRAAANQAWNEAEGPSPLPPRHDRRSRFWYGARQPLLGMRLLLRDTDMLGSALAPVLFVALVCAVIASVSTEAIHDAAWWSLGNTTLTWFGTFVVAFFTTFAALAPVPPFIFARHYARMAARARNRLGLGPRTPYLKPIGQAVGESVAQTIVIAIGIAPLTLALALLPGVGPVAAFIAQLMWTMHWMVIEAFDNGRSLGPGETVESVLAAEQAHPHQPWFARAVHGVQHPRVRPWLAPVRMFVEVLETLVRGWAPEVRMVERDPALCAGFGFGVFALLAIPGINLLFRPALIIAASHLRGQLELEDAGAS